MLTCREVLDFLADYVSAELPEAQRAEFERHLSVCPPCVAYLKSYQATMRMGAEAFDDVDAPPPPEALVQAILAARRTT